MVFVTDLTAEQTILLYPIGGRVEPGETKGREGIRTQRSGGAEASAQGKVKPGETKGETKGNQGIGRDSHAEGQRSGGGDFRRHRRVRAKRRHARK